MGPTFKGKERGVRGEWRERGRMEEERKGGEGGRRGNKEGKGPRTQIPGSMVSVNSAIVFGFG